MATFWNNFVQFVKEIFLFGIDAFMVAAAREVAKRFWARLSGRGGTIAELGEPSSSDRRAVHVVTPGQSRLPFLDEYAD